MSERNGNEATFTFKDCVLSTINIQRDSTTLWIQATRKNGDPFARYKEIDILQEFASGPKPFPISSSSFTEESITLGVRHNDPKEVIKSFLEYACKNGYIDESGKNAALTHFERVLSQNSEEPSVPDDVSARRPAYHETGKRKKVMGRRP